MRYVMDLEKAGPFVGPRGGLWADPEHKTHWDPKRHGTDRLEAMLADLVPGDKVKGVAEQLGKLDAKKLSKLLADVKAKLHAISERGEAVPLTLMRWQRILESVKPTKVKAAPKPKSEPKPKKKEQLSFVLTAPPVNVPLEKTPEPEPAAEEAKPKPKKPKAKKEKKAKEGEERLEEVGEHIWGSRKDLADIARQLQAGTRSLGPEDLAKMSYDDATYLITKANLIPPHDLEVLKGLGHTPGAAHLALAVLAIVKAKPTKSADEQRAYAEDARFVLASLRGATTRKDVEEMLSEWGYKYRRARGWEPVSDEKIELGTSGLVAARERAEQLTKETGIEHAVVRSFEFGTVIAKKAGVPFESLGPRFLAAIKNRWKSKVMREALREARAADDAEDGWAFLQDRGIQTTAEIKARREKRLGKLGGTKRGFSEAALYQGLSGTVKREGFTVAVKDADPERVMATFNLVNIDFGQPGYMTQADREHHTKAFEGAMHDLSEVLGIEPAVLSLNGRLGVAFGARGRGAAKAHYEPDNKAINITKFSGGGSLAHEWGHALDNVMGELFRKRTGMETEMVSLSGSPSHSAYPPEVKRAAKGVMDAIMKHPDPNTARAAHRRMLAKLSREVDEAVKASNVTVDEHNKLKRKPESQEQLDRYVKISESRMTNHANREKEIKAAVAKQRSGKPNRKQVKELDTLNFWKKVHKKKTAALKEGGFRSPAENARLAQLVEDADIARREINRRKSTLAKYRSIDPEQSNFSASGQLMGEYWGRDIELFARGFESFVQDELREAERKSDYLTGGVKTERNVDTGYVLPNGEPAQPYPREAERDNINAAMRQLIEALKATGNIEKALVSMFVLPLETDG